LSNERIGTRKRKKRPSLQGKRKIATASPIERGPVLTSRGKVYPEGAEMRLYDRNYAKLELENLIVKRTENRGHILNREKKRVTTGVRTAENSRAREGKAKGILARARDRWAL